MLQPRYSSRHTPVNPMADRCDKIDDNADIEDGYWRACALCLTTSVGTLTAQAAISPREAAAICDRGAAQGCASALRRNDKNVFVDS